MTTLMICAVLTAYSYVGYPATLWLMGKRNSRPTRGERRRSWPRVTVTVPVHNEAAVIGETLEAILAVEYPAGLMQVVVVSDASTDGTDDIVRQSFESRGVELLQLPKRRGKTAAENASHERVRGEIVINTDASVRVHRHAIQHLVAAFDDPSVGVASGRDVSIGDIDASPGGGEASYVGYEMWVRALETRAGGIVGASGCLFATRADLHGVSVPDDLSRDFAAPLVARQYGYTSVSVQDALCYVPRTNSLPREYHRKVRTMARGLSTLFHYRCLLDPRSHGVFAWKLASHKLCRWLIPWLVVVACVGLGWDVLALTPPVVRVAVALGASGVAIHVRRNPRIPALLRAPRGVVYGAVGIIAGLHAWILAIGGRRTAIWEPTRRETAAVS